MDDGVCVCVCVCLPSLVRWGWTADTFTCMPRPDVCELGLGEVAAWQGWEAHEALHAGKGVSHPCSGSSALGTSLPAPGSSPSPGRDGPQEGDVQAGGGEGVVPAFRASPQGPEPRWEPSVAVYLIFCSLQG